MEMLGNGRERIVRANGLGGEGGDNETILKSILQIVAQL